MDEGRWDMQAHRPRREIQPTEPFISSPDRIVGDYSYLADWGERLHRLVLPGDYCIFPAQEA